jgi:hypothetical protein
MPPIVGPPPGPLEPMPIPVPKGGTHCHPFAVSQWEGRRMSDPDPTIIDLAASEYRQTAGPKKREPILAAGWVWGVLALLSVFAVKLAIVLSIRALH